MSDVDLARKTEEAGGRVFIGFKDVVAAAGVDEMGRVLTSVSSVAAGKAHLRALGLDFEFEFTDMPSVVTRIPSELVASLRANPHIEYVEPIFPMELHSQVITWNVARVEAPAAWTYSTGSGAKLLIIDTGVQNNHPDLNPAQIHSCDPANPNGLDQEGHGTAVAGVAAAVNNAIQIVGVAHGVALWSSKANSGSSIFIDPAYAACAVQFGRSNGVHAINMSFGGSLSYTALTDQINAAYYQNKIIMVASAGNGFGAPVTWPARLDAVIAVSATDFDNFLASFSNVGHEVELAAPGEGVSTTCWGGGVCSVNGTSFAAPHVAAAAALLRAYNSRWSNLEIRRRLAVGATDLGAPGRDTQFGYGLLNTLAAVTAPPAIAPVAGILGPSSVKPNATCTWSATASGGVPPYTYQWLVNYGHAASGQYLTYQNSGGSSLLIQLTVTGADFGQTSVSTTVSVNPGAPVCPN